MRRLLKQMQRILRPRSRSMQILLDSIERKRRSVDGKVIKLNANALEFPPSSKISIFL